MNKREEIVKKHFVKLKSYPNVLSIRTDQTKISDGKDTGKETITIYVMQKIPETDDEGNRLLAIGDTIPKEINGVSTDIVELSGDFEIGRTSKGDLPPEKQKRLMGVIKDE